MVTESKALKSNRERQSSRVMTSTQNSLLRIIIRLRLMKLRHTHQHINACTKVRKHIQADIHHDTPLLMLVANLSHQVLVALQVVSLIQFNP